MFDKRKKRISDETKALDAINRQAKYVCSTRADFKDAYDKNDIKEGSVTYIIEDDVSMIKTGDDFHRLYEQPKIKDTYINGISMKSDISTSISSSLDYEKIFEERAKRFSKAPITEHKCHNCGGTVEMDAAKHIFKCPYCKSVYAVGTLQVNAR